MKAPWPISGAMATLRGDESRLFERHHARLRREVAAYTEGDAELVEDACSFAWTQLVRKQPERPTVFAWLWRVAVRELWRLERVEAAQHGAREPRAEAWSPMETRQRWLEALEAVGALRPRQRRMVGLFARGHSYNEISPAPGSTWRTVDRQLGRARKRLAGA